MKIQILVSILTLGLVVSVLGFYSENSAVDDKEYMNWMKKYGKNFVGVELRYRHSVYKMNSELIDKHNKQALEGKHPYTMQANQFAYLTDEEYKLLHTMKIDRSRAISSHCNSSIEDTPDPKEEIDWTKRAVSPVKTEGSCSASWAFAAAGALEGLYAIDKSKPVSLSAQQLVDCASDYGNEGCNGGLMDQAIWYVMDSGITTSEQYAYIAKVGKCQYKPTMQAYKIKDCAEVPTEKYSKLISAINQQPVAVALAASQFKFYKEGVYNGSCGEDIDAGMLLIGYGKQGEIPYWRVKSSNGQDWGQKGIILIQRTDQDGPGKCGIQLLATVPKGSL